MIERYGGKNVSSISSKTSFVLAGSNMGPSKLEKAQQLGVEVVGEDEFLNRYFSESPSSVADDAESPSERRGEYVEGSLF